MYTRAVITYSLLLSATTHGHACKRQQKYICAAHMHALPFLATHHITDHKRYRMILVSVMQ